MLCQQSLVEPPNTKYDDSSFSSSQVATVTNAVLDPCIANTVCLLKACTKNIEQWVLWSLQQGRRYMMIWSKI